VFQEAGTKHKDRSSLIGTFEVSCKDVLGRVGRLTTKSGTIETPHMFPVVNPLIQPITPKEIRENLKCCALMTNAYLVKKNFSERVTRDGLHKFLDFDGVVATDSGAYQILTYGNIEVAPEEIAEFQETIGSDIAVILDVPTGFEADRKRAEYTVDETIRRADLTLAGLTRKDVLWEGPIQGGLHLDLVSKSARIMSKKPFAIYSLGSPTQVMEHYMFDRLVDMIVTAKKHLPIEKPLHLFGAGHPFMFSMGCLLGCDLFDSAAYAIAARRGKYLTETGTLSLENIEHFPCACPLCSNTEPREIRDSDERVRERFLAEHNLRVCLSEIARIKQAIFEGRLWELVEVRARSHPTLMSALKKLWDYRLFLEKHSPSAKSRGLFYFGSTGLARPEVTKHQFRMSRNYRKPSHAQILLLLPQTTERPYHVSYLFRRITNRANQDVVHICFYTVPYGVVPSELDDCYPLSQTEISLPVDDETKRYVIERVFDYVARTRYKKILLVADSVIWSELTTRSSDIAKRLGKGTVVIKKDRDASDRMVADEVLKHLSRIKASTRV
jgi:7-cyano-7-deazaguanine tRNA-ribosyltransferase